MKLPFALLMLAVMDAAAWVPGGEVPASNWVELVEAVRERREATWYGSNQVGQFYFAAPRDYVQPIKVSLGTAVAPFLDTSDFFATNQAGPVVCQTNGAIVWCWTNHMILDTDYVTYTNGDPWWSEPVMLYGPQAATNLVWTNTDQRLAGFEAPYSLTAAPSRTVLAQLDDDLREVIPRYVDVRLMEFITGLSADDPTALMDAYFATPAATNWYWVDTDNIDEGDVWMSDVVYPASLPVLTVSNAWRWAGIEPYRYPAQIVTDSVVVLGWQAGALGSYIVGTNQITATNWVEEYTFTRAPTLTVWRVPLAQLRAAITNTSSWVATNDDGVVTTTTTNQIGFVASASISAPAWSVYARHSPRLLGLQGYPSNLVQITPPDTGSACRALIEAADWSLHISGVSAETDPGGIFKPAVERSNVVVSSGFTWAPAGSYARAVLPPGTSRVYFTSIGPGGLVVSNWPIREEVWSNSTLLATSSVVGTTIDVWIEGASYEHLGSGSYPIWVLGTNDWGERERVARQLCWMSGHPVNATNWWDGYNADAGAIGSGSGDDRAPNYSPLRLAAVCAQGPSYNPTNTCAWFPDMESVVENMLTGYDPRGTEGAWPLRWSFILTAWQGSSIGTYEERIDDSENISKLVSYQLIAQWPESVTLVGSNLTPRLSADVDYLARLTRNEDRFWPMWEYSWDHETEWFVQVPPSYPATYEHVVVDGCNSNQTTNVFSVVFDEDLLGQDQYYARTWSTAVKAQSSSTYTLGPIDFAGGTKLSADALVVSTHGFSECSQEVVESLFFPRATGRILKDESHVIRWQFRHLSQGTPAGDP